MNLELYRCVSWIVVEGHRGADAGTVYYPTGDPTLSVAANFGSPGDSFPTREAALAYFGRTPADEPAVEGIV